MNHPAWQRILNRIAKREAAIDAEGHRRGPTGAELIEQIQRKTREIREAREKARGEQRDEQDAERTWIQR